MSLPPLSENTEIEQQYREDIFKYLQKTELSLKEYQDTINRKNLKDLKLIKDLLESLAKHNLLGIIDDDTLLNFNTASLQDVNDIIQDHSFLDLLRKMGLLNGAQDSLKAIKDLLTANVPYLTEMYDLLAELKENQIIFPNNFKNFLKNLIKQKQQIPELIEAIDLLKNHRDLLTSTSVSNLLAANENLKKLSEFLVNISKLQEESEPQNGMTGEQLLIKLEECINKTSISQQAKDSFIDLKSNAKKSIFELLVTLKDQLDFNVLEAVCGLPVQQCEDLNNRLRLLFSLEPAKILTVMIAHQLAQASLPVVAIEMLAISDKLYKALPKTEKLELDADADDLVREANRRFDLLKEKYSGKLGELGGLEQVEIKIREKLLQSIQINALAEIERLSKKLEQQSLLPSDSQLLNNTKLLLGKAEEIKILLTPENINKIASLADPDLLLTCRKLFVSTEDTAQIAWRAYDPDPQYEVKVWPKLLTDPNIGKKQGVVSEFTTPEATQGLEGGITTSNNMSLHVRNYAALCFLASQDEMISLEDKQQKKSKQEEIWQDFVINVSEISRVHSNNEKGNIDVSPDIPSCYPGTLARLSAAANKCFFDQDKKPEVKKAIYTAVKTYIERELQEVLTKETIPLEDKKKLYLSLLLLNLNDIKETMKDPSSPLSALLACEASEIDKDVIQSYIQARTRFLSQLTARESGGLKLTKYVKEHLAKHKIAAEEATINYLIDRAIAILPTLEISIPKEQRKAMGLVDEESQTKIQKDVLLDKEEQVPLANLNRQDFIAELKRIEDEALRHIITDDFVREKIIEERFAIEGIKTKLQRQEIVQALLTRNNQEILTSLVDDFTLSEEKIMMIKEEKPMNIINKIIGEIYTSSEITQLPATFSSEKASLSVITTHRSEASLDEKLNKTDKYGNTALMMALQDNDSEKLQELKESNFAGIDLNAQNIYGYTALILAVKNGYSDIVQELLKKEVTIDKQNNQGFTALMLAIGYDHSDIAQQLLEQVVAVDLQDNKGNTALHRAAAKGYVEIVEKLLEKGAKIDLQDNNGNTALHIAAGKGYVKIVEKLLEKGAKIDLQDNNGNTALHIAAGNGHVEIVEKLLERKAKIDLQNNNGKTALYIAAGNGYVEIVEKLLERKAQIDLQDNKGNTALHIAASRGYIEVVQKLLSQKEVKLEQQNKDGKTALHIAAAYGHVNIVEKLLEKGAKIDLQDNKGNTALHIAATYGHVEIVEKLLEKGANPNLQESNGNTALYIAAGTNRVNVVEKLLEIEKKVDLNLTDNDGNTALYTAASKGYIEVVQKLLSQKEVNLEQQNNDGNTALHIAADNGCVEIVEKLLTLGAKIDLPNKDYDMAINVALNKGHSDIALKLIEREPAITMFSSDQAYIARERIICNAAEQGDLNAIRALLDNKGKSSGFTKNLAKAKTPMGYSALELAINGGHSDVVREFLHRGATVKDAKLGVEKIFETAVNKKCDPEVILALIKQDSKELKKHRNLGNNILWWAAQEGHLNIVKELLKLEVEIDSQNRSGNTALMLATKNGHLEIVLELIKKEIASHNLIDKKNLRGKTALDLAFAMDSKSNSIIKQELILHELNIALRKNNYAKVIELLSKEQYKPFLDPTKRTLDLLYEYYNKSMPTIPRDQKLILMEILLEKAYLWKDKSISTKIEQDFRKLITKSASRESRELGTLSEITKRINSLIAKNTFSAEQSKQAQELMEKLEQLKYLCSSDSRDKEMQQQPSSSAQTSRGKLTAIVPSAPSASKRSQGLD